MAQAKIQPNKTASDQLVQTVSNLIKNQEYDLVREHLKKALAADPLQPEAYNLLGIVFEFENEIALAQKMYRAAMAVEPSYTPAIENLQNAVERKWSGEKINYGLTKLPRKG